MTNVSLRLGLLALACFIRLDAGPITYTITTNATGTLGATPFTNAPITITVTGNTSAVTTGPGMLSSYLINPAITATLTIGGLGSSTFTDSIEMVASFNSTISGQDGVVIVDTTNGGPSDPTGILSTIGPIFLGYSIQSALGPVLGPGGVANQGPVDGYFSTTAGHLQFAAGQGGGAGTSTFTAVTTPEPGTLLLVVAGIVASWLWCRFPHRRQLLLSPCMLPRASSTCAQRPLYSVA